MRKKRCPFCGLTNTKKHDLRFRKRRTSQGSKRQPYRRWFCNNCGRPFTPARITPDNFSLKIRACELYYDAEASYRAVGRQLGIAPYRLFTIINALGANCKSTIELKKELKPNWSGYLFIDEKSIWIKGIEWFLLVAIDLKTQDIVHWDLVSKEDNFSIAWFMIVIKIAIDYPFKGVISDLLPEFYSTVRWLLPGIPHQLCTCHAYRATEYYIKYHYTGGDDYWATRFLAITRIILRCRSSNTAIRALRYLERHQQELKQAGLSKRMNILRLRFPYLTKRLQDHNLTPDNNIVENVIKQLNQKLKKVVGFERYETAYNSIALLIIHYRFHKFSCSRISGNNKKSPLELAGCDLRNISWVRFSQKQ